MSLSVPASLPIADPNAPHPPGSGPASGVESLAPAPGDLSARGCARGRVLSVQARVLLMTLAEAAANGAPCPSNFALMDALDVASPDGVRKAMEALRAAHVIDLETQGQRRRVTIRATGARTDWSRGRGHPRSGAAYAGGWENGQDAALLRLARQDLDLATMAARLGRTVSSVRHRLRRLRAACAAPAPSPVTNPVTSPPMDPTTGSATTRAAADGADAAARSAKARAPAPPSPLQRHIVTTADRPEAERDQIAAFLAAGKARKLPPAYAGEVRGGRSLAGIAPISPLARRLVMAMDGRFRSSGTLAARGRLDPLLMPELLHEARIAGLVETRRADGRVLYRQTAQAGPTLEAMGLAPPPDSAAVPSGGSSDPA